MLAASATQRGRGHAHFASPPASDRMLAASATLGITTEEITFAHTTLHRPEMTMKASRNAMLSDFSRIIRLIEDGTINTTPWITHRTPFQNMVADFESFTRPETGVLKA